MRYNPGGLLYSVFRFYGCSIVVHAESVMRIWHDCLGHHFVVYCHAHCNFCVEFSAFVRKGGYGGVYEGLL